MKKLNKKNIGHKILVTSAATILSAVIGCSVSCFLISPEYTSTARYYMLESSSDALSSANEYIKKSSASYVHFFTANAFLEKVADDCGLAYSAEQLKNMVTVKAIDNSCFLDITITADNASDAFQLQQSVLKKQTSYIQNISGNTVTANLVDEARIPSMPSSPDIPLITLCFAAAGLTGGIAICFFTCRTDNHVTDINEITRRFAYPVLAAVPTYSDIGIASMITLDNTKDRRSASEETYTPILISERTAVSFTDAFRKLFSRLRVTLPSKSCKVITISSAGVRDGKTTTAANLAVTIAQSGMRVLIIECDLRNGNLGSFFGIHSSQPGISNILYGTLRARDAIVLTEFQSLFVLCAGTVLSNPTSLLSSREMSNIVDELKTMFDYIIIDTPPVNSVSDTLTLTGISDSILVVVRNEHTTFEDIEKALKSFELSDTNITGFVFNESNQQNTAAIYSLPQNYRLKYEI